MTKELKQLAPESEEDLIRSIRKGDEQAIKIVYRQHYQMLINLVVLNGGTIQEGRDICQETMIILIEKLKKEQFQLNCKVKTFLYSIGRRLWLEQLRLKNRTSSNLSDTEEYIETDIEAALKKEKQFRAMHHALESLGEPCRSIVSDFYLNNYTMESITEKFGYTNTDNAKNQKYKCLQRLKKVFFGLYSKEGGDHYYEEQD